MVITKWKSCWQTLICSDVLNSSNSTFFTFQRKEETYEPWSNGGCIVLVYIKSWYTYQLWPRIMLWRFKISVEFSEPNEENLWKNATRWTKVRPLLWNGDIWIKTSPKREKSHQNEIVPLLKFDLSNWRRVQRWDQLPSDNYRVQC